MSIQDAVDLSQVTRRKELIHTFLGMFLPPFLAQLTWPQLLAGAFLFEH